MSTSTRGRSRPARPANGSDHLSDAERAELLASLEASRAEHAAGHFHVLKPGMLRKEFDAILNADPSDEELDAMLGIGSPKPR